MLNAKRTFILREKQIIKVHNQGFLRVQLLQQHYSLDMARYVDFDVSGSVRSRE